MDNILYWIWFSKITELSNIEKINLLKKYNIKQLWNFKENEALEEIKDKRISKALTNKNFKENLENHITYMKKNNIELINLYDERYPKNLKNIYDFPIALYAIGNINILNNLSIGVVGARSASEYGKKVASNISYMLAKNNINVISGLAKGIDAYSHIGALNANGITVAVIGNGLDSIYPKENEQIYKNIINKNGVILTEYCLGTKPKPMNFPARNRIISGLSDGVLVVEASKKSGSLITVDFALEQGKNIYAVPGNINSPNSIGTNELIKQGAKLVSTIEDILEDY